MEMNKWLEWIHSDFQVGEIKMPFTAIKNNKGNGFEGKLTILRPNGEVQEAVGNTEVVGFKRGWKETQISSPSSSVMDAAVQEGCSGWEECCGWSSAEHEYLKRHLERYLGKHVFLQSSIFRVKDDLAR